MAAMTRCRPGGRGDRRLSLILTIRGAAATMALSGELDVAATERLRAVVGAISDVPGIVKIDIDGRDLRFVDPAGLRALLLTRVDAELAGVSWNLASCSTALRRLLDLAGAPEVLADPALN
jgi:anti-anti-sigma factor